MTIGFDLDGTLIDTHELIEKALAERGYPVLSTESWFYKFKKLSPPKDFQWDVFFYRIFTERWDECKELPGAREFIHSIYGTDRVVSVSTARPYGMLMHHASMAVLNRMFPDVLFSLDIVGSYRMKLPFLEGIDVYFDDRRASAIYFAENGLTVFMRNTTYNRLPDDCQVPNYELTSKTDIYSIMPGTIITYDSFTDLLDLGAHKLFI